MDWLSLVWFAGANSNFTQMKGLVGTHSKVHPKFAQNLERQILSNTFSGLKFHGLSTVLTLLPFQSGGFTVTALVVRVLSGSRLT